MKVRHNIYMNFTETGRTYNFSKLNVYVGYCRTLRYGEIGQIFYDNFQIIFCANPATMNLITANTRKNLLGKTK